MKGMDSATVGTLDSCASCPASDNCCSRVKHGGAVEAPVLLESEARRIAQRTGEAVGAFSRDLGDGAFRQILSRHGCAFFSQGRCDIYEDRPIDCRLFPVDIIEQDDGTLIWIAYTRLCPEGFDRTGLLDHAERLLPALAGRTREYARVEARGMDAEPYEVLGPLSTQ